MWRVSNGLREGPPESGQACFAGIGLTAEQKLAPCSVSNAYRVGNADACDGLTDSEVRMCGTMCRAGEGGLRT